MEPEPTDASFRIEVALADGPRRAGYPVVLVITFTNLEPAPCTLERVSRWFDYELDVVGPDGREARRTRFGDEQYRAPAVTASETVTVAPGGAFVSELLVSRIFDMTRAGPYRVGARRDARSPTRGEWVSVSSPSLAFELAD